RITGAIVLYYTVSSEHGKECIGDVLTDVARLRRSQSCLHAFQRRLLRVEEPLRGPAQEHRARQWAVISSMAAGQLEECAFARLHGRGLTRQTRSSCL